MLRIRDVGSDLSCKFRVREHKKLNQVNDSFFHSFIYVYAYPPQRIKKNIVCSVLLPQRISTIALYVAASTLSKYLKIKLTQLNKITDVPEHDKSFVRL